MAVQFQVHAVDGISVMGYAHASRERNMDRAKQQRTLWQAALGDGRGDFVIRIRTPSILEF